MGKSEVAKWSIAVLAVAGLVAACGDDTSSNGGSAGTGGSAAGTGGDKDASVGPPPDDVRFDCSDRTKPLDGDFGPKGKCCYRTANSTRVEAQGDGDEVTVEYRLNYVQTNNHPESIGTDPLRALAISRVENEEQSILWRFTGPRRNGELIMGEGTATIGTGRYNCDGTYSYYSPTAAPEREFFKDPARWSSKTVPIQIDPSKTGAEASKPLWKDNYNRDFSFTPYLDTTTYLLNWELVNQGYAIETPPVTKENLNCMGERNDMDMWIGGGTFVVYTPLEINDREGIQALNYQTYCQLAAFGVVGDKNSDMNSCTKTARCEPGTTGCTWKKLPDSLCPTDEAQMAIFGCHIGYKDNPDGEPTSCTMEAPTVPQDPEQGVTTEGQCCDPMGKNTDGLPACNAYFLRNDFVAASAEITGSLADELQPNCHL